MAPENDAEKPSDDQGARPEDAAPEVEAEIVDADFTDAPSATTAGAEADPGAGGKAGAPPPELEKPRLFGLTSPFSPGITVFVGYGALVVAAILAFVLWRGLAGPKDAAAPASAEKAGAVVHATDEEAAPETAPARRPADPSKIANVIPADAKEVAAAPPTADPAAAPASARGLPAAPPAGSRNEELQKAAKEALRALGRDDGDAIDIGPPQASSPPSPESTTTKPKINFEIDGARAPSENENAAELSDAAPAASAAPDDREAAAKTANTFTAPKDALEPATQETQIAALRESFERALAERDARANAEIAELKTRLEKIQMASADLPPARVSAAAIAFVNLQRAADRGVPYTEELDVFARLAPGAGQLDRLRRTAASGAPSLVALKDGFDPAARAALAAAARAGASGWLSGIMARLHQLVSIRPAAPQAGAKPVQIISRAEGALDRDDLAAAIRELDALDGAAAAEFAPWLAGARARLAVEESLALLNAALMSELQN